MSFPPGVELVLEAHEQYWRKSPSVKRLVLKAVPDEVTRLAMLKRGEADIAYAFRGPLAEDVRRTPGLGLKPAHSHGDTGSSSPSSGDPRRGSSLPAVVSRLTVLTRLPIASWSRENVVDAQFAGPQELQKADIPVS